MRCETLQTTFKFSNAGPVSIALLFIQLSRAAFTQRFKHSFKKHYSTITSKIYHTYTHYLIPFKTHCV